MKIKILIIILFAFVMSIDCSAKSKHPDEIQDSIMYNGTVYKIVRMWRKNSKGAATGKNTSAQSPKEAN